MTALAARLSAAARPSLGRLTASLPLVSIYVWLCLLYGWEAWGHVTPWLNSDELEFAQLSRAIAEDGEPARRGLEAPLRNLYPWVLAPVWWIHDVGQAYFAAKFLNVLMMTATVFPAYGIARMVASRPWAYFAAAGSATIPALYYSSMLLEEPLAYPWATLCAYLALMSLVRRSRWWIAAAVVAALLAPLVREQLAVVPAAYALACIVFAATGQRAKREYSRWSRWDIAGAATLVVGGVIVVNAAVSHVSYAWLISTLYYKDRMIENGLWAVGAFAVGVGVLPVVIGLAALVRPRGEPLSNERRAFVVVAATFIFGFGWYTAVKAAYISTTFSTLVVERNLTYVAPLLFAATAMFFERPILRWWALAGAAAFTLWAVLAVHPYKIDVRIYADAPGFSLLQAANRAWEWSGDRARVVLVVMVVLSVLVVVLARVLTKEVKPLLATVASLVVLWTLSGQLSAASASNTFSEEVVRNIDEPLNWVDRATGGRRTLYLGQHLTDYNGVWQLEFWNRSITQIWSIDGSAPGPGPTVTPDLLDAATGAVNSADVEFAVVDPGIVPVGELVATHTHVAAGTPTEWQLFHIETPLRLQYATRGVSQDGWAERQTDYSQFTTPGNRPGYAVVRVHRSAWGGRDVPAEVTIRVGALVAVRGEPALGRVTDTCSFTINRLEDRTFLLRTPAPPFHVDVAISRTFVPAEIDPNTSDRRRLGAQVEYSFSPASTVPLERRGCAAGLR